MTLPSIDTDAAEGGVIFDHVVIGGGTAGCILAARLSEDPGRTVVLVEAGADTPPGRVPEDIEDVFPTSYFNMSYFWRGSEKAGRGSSAGAGFPQPRIMGGGSSVMGMWATRGQPCDHDSWRDAGAEGWGWADVLPAYKRVERDLDFVSAAHGDDGAIPIRRHFLSHWPGFAKAVAAAAGRAGFAYREDINTDFTDGIFPIPVANTGERRISAAAGYLTQEVRARPNLLIFTGTMALRLNMRDAEAVSVSVRRRDGAVQTINGREFIVSAGAIHSPALLMRSGIGPADELAGLGIHPVTDLPVGRGLQNHCAVSLGVWLKPQARQNPSMRTYGLVTLRFSSGVSGAPSGDLRIQIVCRTGPYIHSNRIGILSAALYAPKSRGTVSLASPDPDIAPRVDFNLLDHPDDQARMTFAVGSSLQLLADPAVLAARGDVVALGANSFVRRLNQPTPLNRTLSRLLASLVDAPAPLCGLVMRGAGRWLTISGPDAVDAAELARLASPVFHPVGTCTMGQPGNGRAVVDPSCRVAGVRNLRVVDASIMPSIPTAGTFLPVMMVAEHAAERMHRS